MKRIFPCIAALVCVAALAACEPIAPASPSAPESQAPPISSESVSSQSVSEQASSEPVSSEPPSQPVRSETPNSDAPSASTSLPEVKQNPETGDSLGNPSHVPPPSWDQPGPDAEKEALALAQEYLLTLPNRDPNVASVAIEATSLRWNLQTAFGPTAQIKFETVVVGSANSTSLKFPPGESRPWIYEDYRLLPNGWEFLSENTMSEADQNTPNPDT